MDCILCGKPLDVRNLVSISNAFSVVAKLGNVVDKMTLNDLTCADCFDPDKRIIAVIESPI